MNNNPVLLAAIVPDNQSFAVVVRVIRTWHVQDMNKGKSPYTKEMVLMDATGDRIQATIKRELLYKFDSLLQEGSVYRIGLFDVGANVGGFRASTHPYKLNFQFNTNVRRAQDSAVPRMVYHFTNPATIFDRGFNMDFLVDFMGMLSAVGTEREYQKDGRKSKLNIIELDNEGFKFKVTLFGKFVDELNSFIASGDVENAIVAVLYGKAKEFGDKTVLQNSIYASQVIFGLQSVEATALRNRMIERNLSPIGGISQITDPGRISAADEFLTQTLAATIDHINHCDENATFVVLASIDSVMLGSNWWYSACNVCQRKVYPDSNMYYCETCVRHVVLHTPRYRINVRVIDEYDSAVFTVFDRDANILVGRSCSDILEGINRDGVNNGMPLEFDALIGRELLFKVEVRQNRNARFAKTFSLRKFTADVQIIDRFKKQNQNVAERQEAEASLPVEAVAQNLNGKFADTISDSTNEAVDLSSNSDERAMLKRPLEAGQISGVRKLPTMTGDSTGVVCDGGGNDDCVILRSTIEEGQGSVVKRVPSEIPKRIIKIEKE